MLDNPLQSFDLNSWNVRGLGHPRKFKRIRKWTDKLDFSRTILALQETKIGGWKLNSRLQQILPGGQFLVASSRLGRARSVLVLHPSFKVLSWGTCTKGYVVWAQLEVAGLLFGVAAVHAPNKRKHRFETWRWIAEHTRTGNWIILGDLNQVDRVRDSVGPSPRIQGKEERVWRNLVFGRDFSDCFFLAASRTGPRFTRQAMCGNRLDRSRLDRVYISDSASWLHEVATLKHLGSQISGDHIPISASVRVSSSDPSEDEIKQNYFKLNVAMLKSPGFKEECKRAWEEHPEDCLDPRKRWCLGWARIKQLCQERVQNQKDSNEIRRLKEEVQRRRQSLPRDYSEGEIVEMTNLEDELNRLEDQEASLWVQRSRSKWLSEGEAPTSYFFSLAKSKYSRDQIQCLKNDEGEPATSRSDILHLIHAYYTSLYGSEPESLDSRLARQQILQLVDRSLSELESAKLDQTPTREEVESIVKSLKRGKAPGLDGVKTDFLLECWDFVSDECVQMVVAFWEKKNLLCRDSQGCIKLLSKNKQRQWLKNWRPITLMNCTYKIISKLLANRLKPFLPFLVDSEQTGFVPGRRIEDNILTLRLADEWSKVSGDENLFIKLDFTKAFDRVSYTFLWHTLRAMGFSEVTIARIRGLMVGGSSKVLANHAFTKSFKIKRGVRQGCPLAPLLFVLSTQPLMHLRKRFKFLGVWSGKDITQMEISEKITDSIDCRLRSWVNKHLTFSSRLLLIKHVLTAIPSHHLMSVGLDKKGITRINRTVCQFLWGTAESGRSKTPLIAWDKLHLPKSSGGLGWSDLYTQMQTHIAYNALRLLKDGNEGTNWMRLAHSILKKHLANGPKKEWSTQEALLLSTGIRIARAPVLTKILAAWFQVKKHLHTEGTKLEIPLTLSYSQLETLLQSTGRIHPSHLPVARRWAKKLQWHSAVDFCDQNGSLKSLETELLVAGWFPEERDKLALQETWRPIWQSIPSTSSLIGFTSWCRPEYLFWNIISSHFHQLLIQENTKAANPTRLQQALKKILWTMTGPVTVQTELKARSRAPSQHVDIT
ncbi:hypothetical protein R1sor_022591 [Riccia sorocarpa]|uniref:Reverse transcriptase domain-containing protein n=1 Tax=Riccia sorocarpa TaxID=122646 RepID=A0ABD3GKA2_9MARC